MRYYGHNSGRNKRGAAGPTTQDCAQLFKDLGLLGCQGNAPYTPYKKHEMNIIQHVTMGKHPVFFKFYKTYVKLLKKTFNKSKYNHI